MAWNIDPQPVARAPHYMTAREVSRALGMSLDRVYELARLLGGVRLGRQWRFLDQRLPGMPDSPWVEPKVGRPRKYPRADAG